jgi:GTP pyrophosphokinase
MADERSSTLGRRFEEAVVYALHIHAAQTRKGTPTPYIAHLLGVAALVLEGGADEDVVIAALLHDAAEDQGGRMRLHDIRGRFGDRVAAIVDGCTDFEDPQRPYEERKQRYVRHLQEASPDVRRVALADKLHNASRILADYYARGDEVWLRFGGSKAEVLEYYAALVEVLRTDGNAMSSELERTVNDLRAAAAPQHANVRESL